VRIASSDAAHARVFGFGFRISSASVADSSPPNAPTSSSSAAICVRRASLLLISVSTRSCSAVSARTRASAASRSFT